MKKLAIFIGILFSLLCPVFCQDMPSDVPTDHYAYDSIADLVDRGINVSQGYPDGTFRGTKDTTRYENAYFMASLALSLRNSLSVEVDFSDIEEEISYLRNDIAGVQEEQGAKGAMDIYGSVELKSKYGSVFSYNQDHRSPLGPETNYRLKYTVEKQMGDDASLTLNLDTMDGAFNSPTLRTFATQLIDFEGDLSVDIGLANPLTIQALFGPGSVAHIDTSGVAPSDDHTYYARPHPSFIVGTELGNTEISGAYVARGVAADGSVGTSEVYFQLGGKLGSLPLLGSIEATSTSRYIFVDFLDPTSMANDFKQELSFLMTQSNELSEKVLFGAASTDHPKSQFYLNFEMYLKNLYGRGINVNFLFNSVGMDYRLPFDALEFTPLNLFDRKILDGTLDTGLEITAPLAQYLTLRSRSELVTDNFGKIDRDVPGSSFTQELSLDYLISTDLSLNYFYRYYFVPSKIAQFSVAVPEASDLVGLGLVYRF
jgi:S-layer homology domain